MAMAVAVFLGGGDLGVKEAAISAMIMTFTFTPSTAGFAIERFLEALIGGGVASSAGGYRTRLLVASTLLEGPVRAHLRGRALH
jgi:hypothetical protein